MSGCLYADLGWLPKPPPDFNALCRSVLQSEVVPGAALQALAKHSLDTIQLARLAKTVAKVRAEGRSLAPLTPFRLGLLSNATLDFIVPALEATALRHGIVLECIKADYAQVTQEALSPETAVNRARPDAVLIAVDSRFLTARAAFDNQDAANSAIQETLDHFQAIRDGIRQNSGAISILQTLPAFPEGLFGSFDRVLPGAPRQLLDEINAELAESLRGSEDVLVDIAAIAETVGLANWHSPAQWNLARLPFAYEYLPLYAEQVARVVAALRGKSRKCLVLDLDNTVWGGVIGDDGIEGIRIAQGDPAGEAHLQVQRLALALRERGIVLAVSSKNNDDLARKPFREHPEMLLREEHIAVFQANWNDKPANIRAIAEELSLGLDAMVFLDDNPAERELVRQTLPQVAVPELPDDPALYARTLSAAGYFESIAFSGEDLRRTEYYRDNARRVTLQRECSDVDSYLVSLGMEIAFQPFDKTGRARIAQLINKSNQFNLTTRRYTEAEVAATELDPKCFTLQARLLDKFGDNGMISVVICRETCPSTWEIDTWLMSCRVLGRRVQQSVLLEILRHAQANGIERLVGIYKPTGKNRIVEQHYPSLGFVNVASDQDGTAMWELEVEKAAVERPPINVKSLNFDLVDA